MKKWLFLIFIVSWKTQLPNGGYFWASAPGFSVFYDATDFIDKLFVNPNVKEVKIVKKD